jgi:hypothetical protein
MLFRYSRLCGTASDAVSAVILLRRIKIGNPVEFKIIEIQNVEYLKNMIKLTVSKI